MEIKFEIGPKTEAIWNALPEDLRKLGASEVAKRVFQTYVKQEAVMD